MSPHRYPQARVTGIFPTTPRTRSITVTDTQHVSIYTHTDELANPWMPFFVSVGFSGVPARGHGSRGCSQAMQPASLASSRAQAQAQAPPARSRRHACGGRAGRGTPGAPPRQLLRHHVGFCTGTHITQTVACIYIYTYMYLRAAPVSKGSELAQTTTTTPAHGQGTMNR